MEAHIYIETWLERWPEKGDHLNRWPSFNRWCDFIVAIERLAHTCGEKGLIMMYSTWNVHPLHHVVQFVCVYLCCSLQLTLVCHWIVFAIYDDADDNTVCIFQAHIESPVLCILITNCVCRWPALLCCCLKLTLPHFHHHQQSWDVLFMREQSPVRPLSVFPCAITINKALVN